MPAFFPRHTISWKAIEEPPAIRRLTLSLVEMAVITGVVLRVARAVAFTRGPSESWVYFGSMIALGVVFLCAMATLHLGNYTLRQWVWRAPAFAAIEAATESLVSLGLIALGREPMGSERASFGDWLGMSLSTFTWRPALVLSFALALSGVVQLVRYLLLRRDHRVSTAEAVHHEAERQEAERRAEEERAERSAP